MKPKFACWLVLLSGALHSSAWAEPIPFPNSGYVQDFDKDLGKEWTLTAWENQEVWASGATEVTGTSGWLATPFVIIDKDHPNEEPAGITFPLPAKQKADSYLNYGFKGNWLISIAGRNNGARLEFKDLPAHESIDLDMLLAAGGSIDGDDVAMGPEGDQTHTGNFVVVVDGKEAFSHKFNGQGENLAGNGAKKLVQGQVNPALYIEEWKSGAKGPDDRSWVSWATSAGYDLSAFRPFNAIPHTASTLTIDFLHGLDGGNNDEHVAIDNLSIKLAGAVADSRIPFPASGTYAQNFNGKLEDGWSQSGWDHSKVWASGATQVTGTSGWMATPFVLVDATNTNQAPAGVTYPLPAKETPDSYLNYGFAGNWLLSAGGRGQATKVTFRDLPAHTSIDLDLLLAAGGSIDGDDNIPLPAVADGGDASFAIVVDGKSVFQHKFTGGAANFDEADGAVKLVQGRVNPFVYIETWDADAKTSGERTWLNWTTSAGYDLSNYAPLNSIPHTANTLTLEFYHGLESNNTDEHFAIDNFAIKLSGCGNGNTFEEWRCLKFTAAEIGDVNVSGPNANPDGDPYANFLEYAFGLDPKKADNGSAMPRAKIVASQGSNYAALEYRQAALPTDLAVTVQQSTDLRGWAELPGLLLLPSDNGDDTVTKVFREESAATARQRFFRLLVGKKPPPQ